MATRFGPFNTTADFLQGNQRIKSYKTSYKTKPIGALSCAYNHRQHTSFRMPNGSYPDPVNFSPMWAAGFIEGTTSPPIASSTMTQMVNRARIRAYEKFISKIHGNAGVGVNIVERQQAVLMIAARLTQLRKAWLSLKRGDFRNFLYHTGLLETRGVRTPRVNPRHVSRDCANLWLEYHFGWVPLLEDIQSGLDILTRDYSTRASGSSTEVEMTIVHNYDFGGLDVSKDTGFLSKVVGAKYEARFFVSNPDLALLNEMGLLNPFQLVVEVTPFSFVLDWFTNLSAFLGQATDLLGFTLVNPRTNTKIRTASRVVGWVGKPLWRWSENLYSNLGFKFQRELGISTPNLGFRSPKLGIARAATAASLLVQAFNRGH